jgi:hypothetical protein
MDCYIGTDLDGKYEANNRDEAVQKVWIGRRMVVSC